MRELLILFDSNRISGPSNPNRHCIKPIHPEHCQMIRSTLLSLLIFTSLSSAMAQTLTEPPATDALLTVEKLNSAVLTALQGDDVSEAMKAFEAVSSLPDDPQDPFRSRLSPASGALYRKLLQLGTDEQYELLHDWTLKQSENGEVRVLLSLVPEIAPPMEFARAIGQRPGKDSFPVATVGEMPGLFCSAWTLVMAADDSGNLRQLITELEPLSRKNVRNSDFVLSLARLKESRTTLEELKTLLTTRIAPEGELTGTLLMQDAALVAAAMTREGLTEQRQQIVERLNQFNFASGSSPHVPFLKRLRATVILKNRSPETNPSELLYQPPALWVAADDQRHSGFATGADRVIWLSHEEHIQRLAGHGDDALLFRYPLTGKFELKGEATALDHGAAGMLYGGLGFDADQEVFAVRETQRNAFELREWPFIAPRELRMFNRVNIRAEESSIRFLSNLHPGYSGSPASCAAAPWIGLRATGDGRFYFRNLELTGEPVIPREVRISDSPDLRGWMASYGELLPRAVAPFPSQPAKVLTRSQQLPPDTTPAWSVSEGVIKSPMADAASEETVMQSHLAYVRPLLDGETLRYEFFYEEGKSEVHPTLGRLAFLIEAGGVRIHWLTDVGNEWTGLAADNAIIEPLNRRGPRALPLKESEWNQLTLKLVDGRASLELNGEQIYERAIGDLNNHHFGLYHDRAHSSVQVRNAILSGEWPEKLTPEQMQKLAAF